MEDYLLKYEHVIEFELMVFEDSIGCRIVCEIEID